MKAFPYKKTAQKRFEDTSLLSGRHLLGLAVFGLGVYAYLAYRKSLKAKESTSFLAHHGHDIVDEASMNSFPASDSPAY